MRETYSVDGTPGTLFAKSLENSKEIFFMMFASKFLLFDYLNITVEEVVWRFHVFVGCIFHLGITDQLNLEL